MNRLFFFLLCGFIFISCKQHTEEVIVSTRYNKTYAYQSSSENNRKDTIDWQGRYTGVTNCSDCGSLETILILNLDHTYKRLIKHLDKDEAEVEEGNFEWDKEGNSIILDNEDQDKYFVEEDRIYLVNNKSNKSSSLSKPHRVLTKND